MTAFRHISNVEATATAGAYRCTLEIEVGGEWVSVPHAAAPGTGGICDAVLAEIAAGNYAGEIAPYVPPAEPLPHEITMNRAQWLYGMDRHGLHAPIVAALDAVVDPARRAALRAAVFGRERYGYGDVMTLLAANADILPAEVAALTEAQMQAMWATTLTEMPV